MLVGGLNQTEWNQVETPGKDWTEYPERGIGLLLVWVVCHTYYMSLTWFQTLVQDHLDLLWAVDEDLVGMVLHQGLAWVFSSILGECKV